MINHPPFPLTALRLRFTCVAETTLHLGGLRAGSNLRGALVNVMRRATCPGDLADPAHLAACPVCWLVSANENPGNERRGYVLTPPIFSLAQSQPPLPHEDGQRQGKGNMLEPGTIFNFHITLFGEALRYLPYFVLAVPEAGRSGVGPGRGCFALKSIHAERPLAEDWPALKAGENVVHPPAESIVHAEIQQKAGSIASQIGTRLQFEFQTPLRLILEERLLKSPDFGAIFNHILRRLDELSVQYCGGSERSLEERQRLWELANRVRLVESGAQWVDVQSGSSRTGQQTWISGLVGPAIYSAPAEIWRELLPWLLWGEIAQVGKDTAKGNGVYRLKSLP